MKIVFILVAICAAFSLSACGKSDLEKQIEMNRINQKQSGGSIDRIRKVVVAPDASKDK